MARNKTKNQKIKTAQRKKQTQSNPGFTYTLDEKHMRSVGKVRSIGSAANLSDMTDNLFSYNPKLLLGDLAKTILISIVMFGILAVIYFYFNS